LELIVHALVDDPSSESCSNKLVVMAIDNELSHDEQVLENIVVSCNNHIIDLLGGAPRLS
jgi:hypothetical protein